MNIEQKLPEIQKKLKESQLDGWLLYDFRRSNELACEFLGITPEHFTTRRFFYWIPQKGEPVKIVSKIEPHVLNHLPGKMIKFLSWQELELSVKAQLSGLKRIAMEYSPRNAVPAVSKVDAGTIELVRGFGVDVVSSADLMMYYTSTWTEEQLNSHLNAAKILDETVTKAWKFIGDALKQQRNVTEYQVQEFILQEFATHNCVTEGKPICAINAHSADPHYEPKPDTSSIIRVNDFILIDLWCKENKPQATYADITRVGYAGPQAPQKYVNIFTIVKNARDHATDLVRQRLGRHMPLHGWEVDQACRKIIEAAGYGANFIHRTGHNIHTKDHGNGTHMDDLETHDTRLILPNTCFSIEPGIYLPDEFGIRLEYDIYVHSDGSIQVTGGIQDQIVSLF